MAEACRAGDCCEQCHTDYSGQRNWGYECNNCISELPNDATYKIAARYCKNCAGMFCPKCGGDFLNSIL